MAALSDSNDVVFEQYSYDVFGKPSSISSIGNSIMKGGPFCGTIDDIMIFNKELSANEIEQLYLEGIGQ